MIDYKPLEELIHLDSPTGFTHRATEYIFDFLARLGYSPSYTRKGAVTCALGDSPRRALAAHTDTLGAMVCGVRDNGTLSISPIGGLSLNMAEGEYVRIYTMSGKVFTGTFLLDDPSVHANRHTATKKREQWNMHVRLDEVVEAKKDVEKLGIQNGDFICFEPRYQELDSGFIKSRFLDNKAGCFALFEVARQLAAEGTSLPVELFFSNYEEVGHGGATGFSDGVEELLVIDMGVLGEACEGRERSCSICAKDSSGPYDYGLRTRLVELAQKHSIPYVLDVYPFYGSDGSAALRAGNDLRVGLIGPGVAASHGVERTHRAGVEATIDLCLTYARSV